MAQIILKNIGRGKVNKTLDVDTSVTGYDEEDLASLALSEIDKHIRSSERWLEPDDEKGAGFWKLHVGMGYHVGDVEIRV